jgi:predicted molibdopterin-dependent oxidoreductase YjgC
MEHQSLLASRCLRYCSKQQHIWLRALGENIAPAKLTGIHISVDLVRCVTCGDCSLIRGNKIRIHQSTMPTSFLGKPEL